MHRDGVEYHTLDCTRIPHCPLLSDIMQGDLSGAELCFTCTYYSLFSPFQSPLRPCIFAHLPMPYTMGSGAQSLI